MGGKYRLGRKIGSGSFGDIYLGKSASKLISTDVSVFQYCTCHGVVSLKSFPSFVGYVLSQEKVKHGCAPCLYGPAGVGFV